MEAPTRPVDEHNTHAARMNTHALAGVLERTKIRLSGLVSSSPVGIYLCVDLRSLLIHRTVVKPPCIYVYFLVLPHVNGLLRCFFFEFSHPVEILHFDTHTHERFERFFGFSLDTLQKEHL